MVMGPGGCTRSQRHRAQPGRTRRQALRQALAAGVAVTMAGAAWREMAWAEAIAYQEGASYPGSDLLVEPAALLHPAENRALRAVATGVEPTLAALASADDHAAGRLPGAARVDWPELEVIDTSDASLARWRDDLEQKLAALGVGAESTVITYDPGTLFAARLWWVLSYLGHSEVSVLHGGLAAWEAAGGVVVRDAGEADTATTTGVRYRSTPRPELLAQLDEVRETLGDPQVAIVDARTPEEYEAGHIPGAVNLNYVRNAEEAPPRRWLPAPELRAMYDELGVTPDKLVIPYCTSGVRSAVTFFTLRLLGYPDVALYTGSWQEWGARPDLPVTTGEQP